MTIAAVGALGAMALVDSTSIGTLGVPVWMLAQRRVRAWTVLLYLLAIGIFYWFVGLLLLQGFTALYGFLDGVDPRTVDMAQILIGVALFVASFIVLPPGKKAQEARRRRREERGPGILGRGIARVTGPDASVPAILGLALVAGLLELATMVPYLAAVGIISSYGFGLSIESVVLVGYCVLMVAPAVVLLGGRLVAASAVEPTLERLSAWLKRSGDTTLGWVLGVVGVLVVLDGIGRLQISGLG